MSLLQRAQDKPTRARIATMQAEGIQNARAAYNDAVFMRADAATNTTASKNIEKKKITECSNAISRSIISNKKNAIWLENVAV